MLTIIEGASLVDIDCESEVLFYKFRAWLAEQHIYPIASIDFEHGRIKAVYYNTDIEKMSVWLLENGIYRNYT